ncbi:MAG: LysR substrate-binding domain-containing protein [Paracoccaceae bacterium]
MQRSLPPLGWLRSFEAAARHLSFTGAARDLNMTQSAVSQQIKSLEAHLGRPLFHRRPRALELTETGITYLPVVRDAFAILLRGTRAVTGAEQDVLRIQSNLSFAVCWLAPRLPAFRTRYPEVTLEISTELWEPREMAEGAEIEIRYSLRPSDTVRAELLRKDHYYPVCAPGYLVTLDILADQPLYDCANLMSNWQNWFEGQGLNWSSPPITYATTYMVSMTVAMNGGGMCLLHDTLAAQAIREGRLIAPFGHRVPMPEAYYLLLSPQAEQSAHAVLFLDWIREQMRQEQLGGFEWPKGFRR